VWQNVSCQSLITEIPYYTYIFPSLVSSGILTRPLQSYMGTRYFFLPPHPDWHWGSYKLLSYEYWEPFPWGYSSHGVKLTAHLHLLPRLTNHRAVSPLPIHHHSVVLNEEQRHLYLVFIFMWHKLYAPSPWYLPFVRNLKCLTLLKISWSLSVLARFRYPALCNKNKESVRYMNAKLSLWLINQPSCANNENE
jgi:hypothetical protein